MTKGRVLIVAASLVVGVGSIVALRLPGPFWWLIPLFLLLAYQGIIVWGVMDLRLSMFTESVSSVQTQEKLLALTFDDGPDPISTPFVLEALRGADSKATFFVVGEKVERYPEIVRSIAAEGHQIALHSYGHELAYSFLSPDFVAADIARCRRILKECCGLESSNLFRPPVGQASPRTSEGMRRAGVTCVGWSVRGGDGVQRRTKDDCLARLRRGVRPGAIVLLHDAWQGRHLIDEVARDSSELDRRALCPAGVLALSELLTELQTAGYRCITLAELLEQAAPRSEPQRVEAALS